VDTAGDRYCVKYPTPEEQAEQAEAIAQQEHYKKQQAEQRSERLAERLRMLGIDPDI